jgi:hypothetical protein
MVREYVQWIGLLSSSKKGYNLLCENEIFKRLKHFVRKDGKRDHLLAVVLFSLDYSNPERPKTLNFLKFCL